MTIATSDIPNILIERIEGAYPGPALFSARETGDWPAEVLDILLYCDVLRSAVRADSSWCPGCEWQCHKPVVSRTNTVHLETRAFIICDEEPGLGRISIPAPSLVQYEATLSAVCGFIAGRMALGTRTPSAAGASFLLGTIKGRHGLSSVAVGPDSGRLMLRVGRQQEPLAEALLWDRSGLSIDRALVRRLANRKGPAPPLRVSRPPDRTTQQKGVRNTRARHKAIYEEASRRRAAREGNWTAIAATVAETNVHDLKHTFGRRLRAAGVSFEDRQQDLLGHRSGRITTHYSAAELSRLIQAAETVTSRGTAQHELVVLRGSLQSASRKNPASVRENSCGRPTSL